MPLLAVYTTVPQLEQARSIARALVQERLAACVQFEAIESVYQWEGALQQAPEVRLMCKTTVACYPALAGRLRALHPYALPAIHAVAVANVEADYEAWVEAGVSTPGST